MRAEVKEEKYGTRPSILEPILRENNITYFKNLWLATCRASINSDKNTRYLVFLESLSQKESLESGFTLDCFREEIRARVYSIFLAEEKQTAHVKEIKTSQSSEIPYAELKSLVLQKTDCTYELSYARGSREATPFSRFFRENMGKGFSLTDVDFVLKTRTNHAFMEEKTFINNGCGYLGWGQCLSYNELTRDVLLPKAKLYIVFIDESDKFYVEDMKDIDCQNRKYIQGWGQMVEIALGEPMNKEDFTSWVKEL